MKRVLEELKSLNGEYQQMRDPASVQPEPAISIVQGDSELSGELFRKEATKEATVKVVV